MSDRKEKEEAERIVEAMKGSKKVVEKINIELVAKLHRSKIELYERIRDFEVEVKERKSLSVAVNS